MTDEDPTHCKIFVHGFGWDTTPKPQSSCSRNGYFETYSCGDFETPNPNPNPSLPGHGVQLQTKKNSVMKNKKKKKKKKERTAELKQKKAYNKEKKFHNEIEEKRWSEGWAMLLADGYGEKRVAWEEKRKRKKKKKKKEKRWFEG